MNLTECVNKPPASMSAHQVKTLPSPVLRVRLHVRSTGHVRFNVGMSVSRGISVCHVVATAPVAGDGAGLAASIIGRRKVLKVVLPVGKCKASKHPRHPKRPLANGCRFARIIGETPVPLHKAIHCICLTFEGNQPEGSAFLAGMVGSLFLGALRVVGGRPIPSSFQLSNRGVE